MKKNTPIIIHSLTILFIELGIFCWYQYCKFGDANWTAANEDWVTMYYLWDKAINVFLVLCVLNPLKLLFPFWILIGTFFVIRFGCEYWSVFMDIGKFLTHFKVMFLINLLCLTSVIVIKCRK